MDTAALKRAKVPIFGKWYFPDLPANEPLVNLSTGQIETFPAGYRAGAVLYVKEDDLKRAGIGPYKAPLRRSGCRASSRRCAGRRCGGRGCSGGRACSGGAGSLPRHRAPPLMPRSPAARGPVQRIAPAHASHARGGPRRRARPPGRRARTSSIALILSLITAVEVWVYYIPALLEYIFPILIMLSIVKFVMVVGWFMHLKFDHPSFTWFLAVGWRWR